MNKTPHLKVEKKKGEQTRRRLMREDLLDNDKEIQKDEESLFLPLKKETQGEIVFLEPEWKKSHGPSSFKEVLEKKFPDNYQKIPTSFDQIGDIAVIEVPEQFLNRKKIIGRALLNAFKNIKVVARKKSKVETSYRTRRLEILAGENRTVTTHKEHGCLYELDVESAYFSPRLSRERKRVADKVRKGERVLVMFAGVGPYAILIAKKRNPSEVMAVELNPDAIAYMQKNIRLNKVQVKAIEGDVAKVTPELGSFDRIVMPLPKDADSFLDVALPALKREGVIHFYDFSSSEKESSKKVKEIAADLGYEITILETEKCGSFAPGVFRVCVDFRRD